MYLEKHLRTAASVSVKPLKARAKYCYQLLTIVNASKGRNQVLIEGFMIHTSMKVQ